VRLTSVNQHHLAKKPPDDRVRGQSALDNAAGSACGSFATDMRWPRFPFPRTSVLRQGQQIRMRPGRYQCQSWRSVMAPMSGREQIQMVVGNLR
jgi:hypothetical protein